MKLSDKALIYDFMQQHTIGVISTINAAGQPEAAVVGFAQTPDLELTFGTSINSRKANNIKVNPKVAFVIGWDQNITVQYQGQAALLMAADSAKYQDIHFAKVPSARKYANDPDERYFLVRPNWIRYTDCNQSPWKVIEMEF